MERIACKRDRESMAKGFEPVNLLESRNNVVDINHREHDRNYGFALMLNPNTRFGFEFGYNYHDIFSTTDICYVFGAVPPPGSVGCPGSGGPPFLPGVSLYVNKINFGYTNITFKPVKRVTANLDYSLTSSSGNTRILSPKLPTLGPLGLNFHKPAAWVDLELHRRLSWGTAWNYYDYNEKSSSGRLLPRDFQRAIQQRFHFRYAFYDLHSRMPAFAKTGEIMNTKTGQRSRMLVLFCTILFYRIGAPP